MFLSLPVVALHYELLNNTTNVKQETLLGYCFITMQPGTLFKSVHLVVGLLHLVSLKQPTFFHFASLLWSLMAHSHLHKTTKPSKQTKSEFD